MSVHRPILRPSRRVARFAAFAAAPAAIVLSGLVVAGSSYSAFSATTANPTNNWTTGTVSLTDDDSGTALFNATGLKPGDTASKCIVVTYGGSLASKVKLYATAPVTGALAENLSLKIEQGASTSTGGTCTGFTPASTVYDDTAKKFTASGYADGLDTSWAPSSASSTKTFKITYTVSSSTPNTAQGATTALGFTWEAQNS